MFSEASPENYKSYKLHHCDLFTLLICVIWTILFYLNHKLSIKSREPGSHLKSQRLCPALSSVPIRFLLLLVFSFCVYSRLFPPNNLTAKNTKYSHAAFRKDFFHATFPNSLISKSQEANYLCIFDIWVCFISIS